mmetsp:Transcript_70471/g.168777  ORF Transcript_70471/g.168777 Transcript_70471/m.168777 type:complete len:211 (-) Transcript_70471:181-813(-)
MHHSHWICSYSDEARHHPRYVVLQHHLRHAQSAFGFATHPAHPAGSIKGSPAGAHRDSAARCCSPCPGSREFDRRFDTHLCQNLLEGPSLFNDEVCAHHDSYVGSLLLIAWFCAHSNFPVRCQVLLQNAAESQRLSQGQWAISISPLPRCVVRYAEGSAIQDWILIGTAHHSQVLPCHALVVSPRCRTILASGQSGNPRQLFLKQDDWLD